MVTNMTCSHDIGTGVLCGYPELHPVHQIAGCQGYHPFEGESHVPIGFVDALAVAQGVLARYKQDHLKWWKRMDGTPLLNDIAVRMAEAFAGYLKVDKTITNVHL